MVKRLFRIRWYRRLTIVWSFVGIPGWIFWMLYLLTSNEPESVSNNYSYIWNMGVEEFVITLIGLVMSLFLFFGPILALPFAYFQIRHEFRDHNTNSRDQSSD